MKMRAGVTAEHAVAKAEHLWSDDDKEAYEPPAPLTYDHLDFEPQPMVGWYQPMELAKAGVQAILSAVFGSYADKREVEIVLSDAQWHDYSDRFESNDEGLWFDYVADLGDGWDSTYTIARLLAEKELGFDDKGQGVKASQKTKYTTQRGRILVMGGDQVYPTSSRKEYRNRMTEPYRCALPYVPNYLDAPHLFLVPGNHDWYDGLTSFFSLFCYQHWVGGWKTWQRRSYFALKLIAEDQSLDRPDVWLWGIDIQLSSNIDQPQLDYFGYIAREVMKEGSRIILCTAEPSWVYVDAKTKHITKEAKREKKKEEIYANLGHLEKNTIKPYNHEVLVGLAGDWHNYTRYESKDGKQHQRFVSGGGGAYLYPTHHMPEHLKLPERNGGDSYTRKAIFPNQRDSYWLVTKGLFFTFFRHNWGFTFLLGLIYLLLSWIVQSVSKVGYMLGDQTLLERFSEAFDIGAFIEVIAHSPGSVIFVMILVGGMIGFSTFETTWKRILHGGIHGLAHLTLFLWLFHLNAKINLVWLDEFFDGIFRFLGSWGMDHPVQVVLFSAEMLIFGMTFGGIVMGVYLWFSNRVLKIHDNEVLLCQSNPDYKNFLRFHIKKDGDLTIYPIGVKRVNRKRSWKRDKTERHLAAWTLNTKAEGGASWFEPKEGAIEDFAELIEDPITVSLNGGNTHG